MSSDDSGVWLQRLGDKEFSGQPALFLDRDGVIVEEVHFLRRAEDVRIIDGVAAAIAAANDRGVAVVVVTNQSGIARGHFGWPEFEAVQTAIMEALSTQAASIDLVMACGYHADGVGPLQRDHPWRKPQPGMLLEAEKRLHIDLPKSFIVGDRLSDILAGRAAGLVSGALVSTGYGTGEWQRHQTLARQWSETHAFELEHSPTAAEAIYSWLDRLPAL